MNFDGKLALTSIRRPPIDANTWNQYGFLNTYNGISRFKNDLYSLYFATQKKSIELEMNIFRTFNLFRMEFFVQVRNDYILRVSFS